MAPKPKHERLIQGSWDSLGAEQKKNAVKLNSDYYIVYPLELSPESFKMKAKYANESESTLKEKRNQARNQLKSELVLDDFKEKNLNTSKLLLNGSSVLEKDWRLFKFASPEMQWVKKSLAALNNVLEEGIADYINEQGVFDSDKYQERVNKAYDEFFLAAQNYLDNRNPSSIPGKRRRRRVDELLVNAKKSKQDFNVMIENSKDGMIKFEDMSPEKRQSVNAYNLVTEIPSQVADEVAWQNEGNSTDVYRVHMVGDDNKHYYLKENLPFLNENMGGFLTRRSRQLNVSRNNMPGKQNADPDKVEERIKNISEKDYDNALTLINNLNNAINRVGDAEKLVLGEKFAKYFAYNFDTIFKDLEMYNSLADNPNLQGNMTLDQMIQKAKDDGDDILEQGLSIRKAMLEAEGILDAGGKEPEPMEKMSAYEFLVKTMKLNNDNDKLFMDSIKDLSDKELETLFRVTMGKEVELFGQMSAQGMQKGEDKAAINNTATSRVAEHLGFDDVITKSHTSLVKFKRRDGTEVNQLCTVCEEAEGTEFIDIMKTAEKEGVKIIYSPEAIRNLMRLQAIDTLCLQKDRHGRNFKCQIDRDPKTKNIIIKSLKAYDNDMSFDAIDLKTAFDEASNDPKRVQFLPPMTQTIKKDSALYKHILGNYFGVDVVSPIKIPETPSITIASRYNFSLKGVLSRGPKYLIEDKRYKIAHENDLSYNWTVDEIKFSDKMTKDVKDGYIKEMKDLGINYDPENEMDCFQKFVAKKIVHFTNEIKSKWYVDDKTRKALNDAYKEQHEGKNRPNGSYPYNFDLDEQQKKDLENLINDMRKFHDAFDFSKLSLKNDASMGAIPYVDIFFKTVIYTHDIVYGDSIDKRFKNQCHDYNAASQLLNNNGDFEIPTMLHYDNEAYMALQKAVVDYRNPNSVAVNNLKKLGLSNEKIEALARRNEQMLEHINNARDKALLFYKAAGYDPNSVKAKFFLDKADYKELNSLTDFAIDPGNTYLAIDNENYLCGQKFQMKVGDEIKEVKFTDLMNDKEKQIANDYNTYIQNDKKRWKYEEQDKEFKKYDVSNTDVKLITVIDAKYYVNACIDDAIYNVAHNDFETKEKLIEGFKEILFTQRMRTNKPLNIDSVKQFMEKNSNLRAAFNNELNSPEGKIFMKNLNSMLENEFNNRGYKKLTDKNLEKSKKKIFDKSLDDIFDKFKAPGADKNAIVEGMAKDCKNMKDFAKKFGVDIDPETALQQFIQKNPGVLTQEQINKIMNAIKPQQAQVNVNNNGPAMVH